MFQRKRTIEVKGQDLDAYLGNERFQNILETTENEISELTIRFRSMLFFLMLTKKFKSWSDKDEIQISIDKNEIVWKVRLFGEKEISWYFSLIRFSEELEMSIRKDEKTIWHLNNDAIRNSIFLKNLVLKMLLLNDAIYRRNVERTLEKENIGKESEELELEAGISRLETLLRIEFQRKRIDGGTVQHILGLLDHIKGKKEWLLHHRLDVKHNIETLINKDLLELIQYYINMTPSNQKMEKEKIKKILAFIQEKIYQETEQLDHYDQREFQNKIEFLYKKFGKDED